MASPKPRKRKKIRLQCVTARGDVFNLTVFRDSTVDELCMSLSSSATSRPFFEEGTPADAFCVTLKNANGEALSRGKALADYKLLTKKVARVHVRIDDEIMAPVREARAQADAERASEAERAGAREAERGRLNWNTLCFARLLEARGRVAGDAGACEGEQDKEPELRGGVDSNGECTDRNKSDRNSSNVNANSGGESVALDKKSFADASREATDDDSAIVKVSAEDTTVPGSSSSAGAAGAASASKQVFTNGTTLRSSPDDAKALDIDLHGPSKTDDETTTAIAIISEEEPAAPTSRARAHGEPTASDPSRPSKTDMEAAVLNVLRLLPECQLYFEKYDQETHGPRVHMSETIKDRENRQVLLLSLRGKNFTQTQDIELHEDSHLLHLFLAIEQTFGLPMVHIQECDSMDASSGSAQGVKKGDTMTGREDTAVEDVQNKDEDSLASKDGESSEKAGGEEKVGALEATSGKSMHDGSTPAPTPSRLLAMPAVLVRRSWAQFVASLPEDSFERGDILKMDMVGCPSSEWTKEEKFGSMMDPTNWFKKIVDLGIVDNSRSGTVILDDLRPPNARLGYDNVLRAKAKPGFL